MRNFNPINFLPSNKVTNQHLDASLPPVLFPYPMLQVTTRHFGKTMEGTEVGAGSLTSCFSSPAQLLQHGLFQGSSSHWMLYLPWTRLSFFSVPCPFLNTFPWRHPNLTWLVQFWGSMGQFFSGTKPGVSSTGQSLTRQSKDIFPQAGQHALSVTCFSILPSSGVTLTVLENYLLFSPCMVCQVLVR